MFRWKINDDRFSSLGDQETVIFNMNDDGRGGQGVGNHRTRSLVFDDSGRLYVSVGSVGNIDVDSFRSRIRRFDIASVVDPESTFPINFVDGDVFADGVRNEVGMAFDPFGVLWGGWKILLIIFSAKILEVISTKIIRYVNPFIVKETSLFAETVFSLIHRSIFFCGTNTGRRIESVSRN